MTLSVQNTLADWLGYIESIHPAEIELGLSRVSEVARRLGLLQSTAKIITVAGTNGKGSCVASLEALLRQAGLRCGSYTSPHFLHYNERIKVDGCNASDKDIVVAFTAIEQARAEISLSYFEYGTLAALQLFHSLALDVLILEVGLGGRLDAVNIIDPDVAIVTSIALDHEDWLGSDINIIGREKAGIFRSGRWAICADAEAPSSIKDYAREVDAKLLWAGQEFEAELSAGHLQLALQQPQPRQLAVKVSELPINSQVAAIQALACLGMLPAVAVVERALVSLQLAGRGQAAVLGKTPVVLDVAHNPAAVQRLARQLGATMPMGRLVVIAAMMGDKDYASILSLLAPLADEFYVCDLLGNTRAAKAAQLQQALSLVGAKASCFASVAAALAKAQNALNENDLLVVMGSFFTVGEAMAALGLDV